MRTEVAQAAIVTVIAGMGIANFTIRYVPIALLSRIELPRPILRWLTFVPVSVMGALVANEVLRPGGQWTPPLTNPGVYAAAVTALAFRFTRSFLGATIAGIVSFVALRAIM